MGADDRLHQALVAGVIRRTVAAMGVTLLGYAGVRAAVTFLARPHFGTPLVVSSPIGQGNVRVDLADWVLHTEAVDAVGHVVGRGGGIDLKVMVGRCPAPNRVAVPPSLTIPAGGRRRTGGAGNRPGPPVSAWEAD